MACDCKKDSAKITGELKKIRQTVQDLTRVLADMNKTLGKQLNIGKEEFIKEQESQT